MPEISDDAWIDFQCLTDDFAIKDNLVIIYYNYDDDEKHDPALIYQLRVAMRAVGHKINSIHYTLGKEDHKIVLVEILTSISRDEWLNSCKMYRTWAEKTKSHEIVEDDLSDEEVNSVDTDPITC